MNFTFSTTPISDLVVVEPKSFGDSRGYFFESYKFSDFAKNGIEQKVVQINQSFSQQNVVRGLHFQKNPYGQGKLVRCLQGEILDVAVDLRKNSPTFGQYFSVKLSSQNRLMLFVPIGFAHGFSVLSETAEVSYNVFGGEYNKASEGGIRFDDPSLKIDWQIPGQAIVSEKDQELPFLKELEEVF